jgi:hypothetical protein
VNGTEGGEERRVNGLVCRDRLDALLRVIEHEVMGRERNG